jgi:HK97 family phage major capsid protein
MGDELKTNEDVVKAVKAEIKSFGENTKKNYDELKSNYEDLKKELKDSEKNSDTLIKEKVVKLTEDITTRQEDLDEKIAKSELAEKAVNDRIDQLEVALKRTPKDTGEKATKEEKEARDFMIDCMVINDKTGKGANWEQVLNREVDVDEYKAYRPAFDAFLRKRDEKFLSADHLKALTLGTDPDGGYTVTPVMSNRIVTRLFESDPIRQMASVERISTDAIEWMVDYDEAGWGWEAETVAGGETDTPQWFKKRIPVHVQYAKPRASQTLLEDSGINIENWLADKVANRFSRGEAASFITGDGVGKPRGILTYSNYATAGVDEYGKIERTNMGAAAALTTDGFIDVKYSLIEQYLDRGTWLMNRLTVADTMKLKDGEGNFIWKPGLAEDRHGTILGLPLRMSTTMPVVAAGALSVAIADWAEAYMVVDRLGITVQRDPYTVKPMVEFYTRKRVGGDVTNYQAIKLGVIAA